MVIWWGKELVQLYNDGYSATMGQDRHPPMLGTAASTRTDTVWQQISPAINAVMAGDAPVSLSDTMLFPTDGAPLLLELDFCPIDRAGTVGGVLGIGKNFVDDHENDEQLAKTSSNLVSLFESCPGFIVIFGGPDHVFEFVNNEYKTLMGDRNYIGKSIRDVVPDIAGQGFYELLDRVYSTGETYVGKHMPLHYDREGTGKTSEAVVDFVYKPLITAGGHIYGVFVEGTYTKTDRDPAPEAPHLLTQREREVLGWIAMGKTAGETATIMHLSKRTCETHIYSAARKLDAANSTQTVVEAIRRGEIRL
ncbi:MAG: hypothetical protein JWP26_4314 [Devosia sp.]|uniref:PAS and helix-turn-helix domain-containing protein n=1 Tax=Devosia sp. TaxID=1871048 RepID=UPI002613587E|nr:PAS and helix-turn-helix domain-containing protein [Devosia sp.]MDB5537782.1 hypothetical protein [Devosia sp.]MDB5589344.1 hypothetical protein [Devosia sp.]